MRERNLYKQAAGFFLLKTIAMAIAFVGFSFTAFAGGDFQRDFENANQQYDLGKFSEAESLYNSIIETGHFSPELFYNLGNTEFRLKKSGEAILNYERALALSPGNPEAQANLTFVRNQTGAKIAPEDWQSRFIAGLNADIYCWSAACAAWIVIFALAIIFLKSRSNNRAPWFVAVCFAVFLGYAAFAVYHFEQDSSLAIVISKSAEARLAPFDNSALAAALPEGSRVWVLERRGPWIYCMLPDNSHAWISSDVVQRVHLHAS
ncbi:MAG: tetratricopeptide repeat protein [Chthoniobacteraceae bacterium]